MNFEEPIVACLYFIMLIFVGSFFLINIILAVMHRAVINSEYEQIAIEISNDERKLDEAILLLKAENEIYDIKRV